jgi:hypothetical protein
MGNRADHRRRRNIRRAHYRVLSSLKAVHATIQNNSPLSSLFNISLDADKISEDDDLLSQKYDLDRYFIFLLLSLFIPLIVC